ncbi:MAG TPA: outer membrane beta-barrel protein [Candidatus Saccharimonadales bacterium]|nr:outer membrane beta-barrel protein [Candidatus Saccharimonadales bacterium]
MKNRNVAGMVASLLCLGATVAQAQYYYYLLPDAGPIFRFGVGPSFFQDGRLTEYGASVSGPVDFDTGLAFDAAIGWAFNRYAALDFETGFIGAGINNVPGYISDNSRLYSVPLLVNFTLSYPIPRTILVPYIGAGVGGADMVFDTDQFGPNSNDYVTGSENDVEFAGQAFAGLRFQFSRNFSLDLGYKYFATGDPTLSYPNINAPGNFDVGFRGVRTHSILFGLAWKF